jgi:hypothetical protein
MSRTCEATRRDGRPCTTPVVSDGRYCFGHDPGLAAQRAEARRLGGQNRANAKRLSKLLPPRLLPVWEQLEAALGDVLTGTLEPKRAAAAASVARAMVAVLTAGELEERVRALEAQRVAE